MGISLLDFFELDNNGNIVKDTNGIATINSNLELGGEPVKSYEDCLNALDSVTSIGLDPYNELLAKHYVSEVAQILLKKFQEHLRKHQEDWYQPYNPQLYTVAKQLEAFAYLTGHQPRVDKILDEFPALKEVKCNYDAYQNDNFLAQEQPLQFPNFDRQLLTLQMALRVLDPRLINQREEQVCGTNCYAHNIALFNPLQYVQIVSTLANEGQFDLKGKANGLHIELSSDVKNKKSSDGEEIHDADHILLNGLRSSENNVMNYGKGPVFLKQLFGVTTPSEVKRWMKQSGYTNVKKIAVHDRDAIHQLQLLIQDGYMVGFSGTITLANFILDNSQKAPKKLNVLNRAMDGHFFTIKSINYDEIQDQVNIRMITWGQEVEASIPFKVWKNHVGVVGKAIVGQNPYSASLLRTKAREISLPGGYCSSKAYCVYIRGLITNGWLKHNSKRIKVNALLDDAFNHSKGCTWTQVAKELQDFIESLPEELRPDIPKNISIIPEVDPDLRRRIDAINNLSNRKDKISALEFIGTQGGIEIQRQLIPLYVQEGKWDEIRTLFADINSYSKTDQLILKNRLDLECQLVGQNNTSDIVSLIKENITVKVDDLIPFLNKITGLPKGGAFTYGIQGRLLEVVNQRLKLEGKDAISHLHQVDLERKDLYSFISLLDHEMHQKDSKHQMMDESQLDVFCDEVIENVMNKEQAATQETSHALYQKPSFMRIIKEFFLKVASLIFSEPVVSTSVGFKNELTKMRVSEENTRPEDPLLSKNI